VIIKAEKDMTLKQKIVETLIEILIGIDMNVKNILLEGKGKIIQEVEAKAMNKTK
jgi:hypothetical protein